MTFIIESRTLLRPTVTFASHLRGSVEPSHVQPILEPLPVKDIYNIYSTSLRVLRSIYTNGILAHLFAKYKNIPENPILNSRIIDYIDNYASILLFDFPDQLEVNQIAFTTHPGGLIFLANACREILTEGSENVIWDGVNPLIRADWMDRKLGVGSSVIFQPHAVNTKIGDELIISRQLIHRRQDKTDYYEFADPNGYYALVAYYYLENYERGILLDKLDEDNLLGKNNLVRVLPILSYIAEGLFIKPDPSAFEAFILGLPEKIGGEEGFAAVAAITEDLLEVYKSFPARGYDGRLITKEKLDILRIIPEKLRKNYEMWRYENRPYVIPQDTLADAMRDKTKFWDVLFERSGVQAEMENLFGKSNNQEIRSIYETAIRERKVIPGLILILSHVLGSNPEISRRLAAISLFTWGVIVSYDNIIDSHTERKGFVTEFFQAGLPTALNNTMLALKELLTTTLDDNKLIAQILDTLELSCRGDNWSRTLDWHDTRDDYILAMRLLVSAFSSFPKYIGDLTGQRAAAHAFKNFLNDVHTLGQMNNDIEDTQEGLRKHDEGSDIGQRKTLFWKTLVELPDDIVSPSAKQVVIDTYEKVHTFIQKNRRPPTTAELPEILEVLEIGRTYRSNVVQTLYPELKKTLYEEAKRYLQIGFDDLPKMDAVNRVYKSILAAGLEEEWRKFCEFGLIDPNQ